MTRLLLALHRVRLPLYLLSILALVGGTLVEPWVPAGLAEDGRSLLVRLGLAGLLLTVLVITLGGRLLPHPDPLTVTAPVTGRWSAVHSPATKVPSHGLHAYGQTWAIDLVHEPDDEQRPELGSGPAMRPPEDFPAFGQPVLAMVDGEVVAAADGLRDHRSRSSLAAVLYMTAEGMLREIGGPRFIVGNHVIIRTPDGVHALVAHLRRGSAQVAVGDTVRAGDQIGACGNSGNTSEPHVHAHLMDRRSLLLARGLPMAFADIDIERDGSRETVDGLPADEERMVATSPSASTAGTA